MSREIIIGVQGADGQVYQRPWGWDRKAIQAVAHMEDPIAEIQRLREIERRFNEGGLIEVDGGVCTYAMPKGFSVHFIDYDNGYDSWEEDEADEDETEAKADEEAPMIDYLAWLRDEGNLFDIGVEVVKGELCLVMNEGGEQAHWPLEHDEAERLSEMLQEALKAARRTPSR